MEPDSTTVRLHGVPHPSVDARQAGFPLDHPYLEQCWSPAIGPTSVLLLRCLPLLWRQAPTVEIELQELSSTLGLGRAHGNDSAINRTLDRLVRFKFATRTGPDIDIYTEVPPLSPRALKRLPDWNRDRHEHLLAAHLDRLAELTNTSPPAPTVADRLNQLCHPTTPPAPTRTLAR